MAFIKYTVSGNYCNGVIFCVRAATPGAFIHARHGGHRLAGIYPAQTQPCDRLPLPGRGRVGLGGGENIFNWKREVNQTHPKESPLCPDTSFGQTNCQTHPEGGKVKRFALNCNYFNCTQTHPFSLPAINNPPQLLR